jgi:hypothetical protein
VEVAARGRLRAPDPSPHSIAFRYSSRIRCFESSTRAAA